LVGIVSSQLPLVSLLVLVMNCLIFILDGLGCFLPFLWEDFGDVSKSDRKKSSKKSSKDKRKKRTKDPNAPKRPQTAFFLFMNDRRAALKQERPDIGFGDVAKILSEEWKKASKTVKDKYEAIHNKDKERYERELAAYNANQGSSSSKKSKKSKKDESSSESDSDSESS